MRRTSTVVAALAAVLVVGIGRAPARAGDPKPDAPAKSAAPAGADVQKAIDRGAEWLRKQMRQAPDNDTWQDPIELEVLTLAHTGGTTSDPVFAKALAAIERNEPRTTYRAALLAMALAEVNPRMYQRRIAYCAQWFVDTQLPGGEWAYPGPPEETSHKGIHVQPPPVPEGTKPEDVDKPRDKVLIERRESLTVAGKGPMGDFSNTQFAILGLRAARDAGVEAPAATWKAALDYLKKFQHDDGGWGYVLTGQQDESSYASLTAAGVCSAAICLHALGAKNPKGDPIVTRGLAWLAKHPDVSTNVGIDTSSVLGPSPWQYYHLYSVERAGRVLGLADVGGRPWYDAGATWLLGSQREDGRWEDDALRGDRRPYMTIADTCFALLFLTRATRPLTGGR